MRVRAGLLLLSALAIFSHLAAFSQTTLRITSQEANSPPTISVNVRLVNVFVGVTDSSGAPVPGLSKSNFSLYEDGREQRIAVFERQTELPLSMVLAVDTSGSVQKDLFLEQEAARRFVHAILRPMDALDVMEFSDDVREITGFTNRLRTIDHGLNELQGGGATALYSAVYLASQSLSAYSGRKVLVLISDGSNTVKGTTYEMALRQAERGDVMVYSIIDVPIASSAGRDLAGEHAMIALSEETGGRYYYEDTDSLDTIFRRLSEDLRTQYLLGYYPEATSSGGSSAHPNLGSYRTISVSLKGLSSGATYLVHNRAGYYASGSR